jgi:hypothetical protein
MLVSLAMVLAKVSVVVMLSLVDGVAAGGRASPSPRQ